MDKFTISCLVAICFLSLALYLIENHNKVIPLHHKTELAITTQDSQVQVQVQDQTTTIREEIKARPKDQKNTPFQNSFSDLPMTDPDNFNIEYIQIDTEIIDNLVVGQEVEFLIPQESTTYTGTIESASDIPNSNTRIAFGMLTQYDDSRVPPSFSIVKEENITFATIRTGGRTFRFEVDNDTGTGEVTEDLGQDQSENDSNEFTPDPLSPSPQVSRESFFDT